MAAKCNDICCSYISQAGFPTNAVCVECWQVRPDCWPETALHITVLSCQAGEAVATDLPQCLPQLKLFHAQYEYG
jgi:hypothetical protein